MTSKNLTIPVFLLIVFVGAGCSTPAINESEQAKSHKISKNYISIIKTEKQHIDNLTHDTSALLVLVKVPHNNALLRVKGDNFPDEIETTFNLLKDKNGRVIYAVEIPFSESGDWFISYKSYFGDSGKLLAFEREANFFNSECTGEGGGAVHEKLVKYYDESFDIIDSAYTLHDNNKKPLKKSDCFYDYDYPYTIHKTLKSFLAINNIKI